MNMNIDNILESKNAVKLVDEIRSCFDNDYEFLATFYNEEDRSYLNEKLHVFHTDKRYWINSLDLENRSRLVDWLVDFCNMKDAFRINRYSDNYSDSDVSVREVV